MRSSTLSIALIYAATLGLAVPAEGQTVVVPKLRPPTTHAPLLPGSRTAVGVIQGNALSVTNGPLPDAIVRLRDARTGRIVDAQLTDKAGLFKFPGIDPGSYIVELVSPDQTILTASDLLSINAGDTASTVVKVPLRTPPLAGAFGRTAPAILAVTTAAAAAGVVASRSTGRDITGQQ